MALEELEDDDDGGGGAAGVVDQYKHLHTGTVSRAIVHDLSRNLTNLGVACGPNFVSISPAAWLRCFPRNAHSFGDLKRLIE